MVEGGIPEDQKNGRVCPPYRNESFRFKAAADHLIRLPGTLAAG